MDGNLHVLSCLATVTLFAPKWGEGALETARTSESQCQQKIDGRELQESGEGHVLPGCEVLALKTQEELNSELEQGWVGRNTLMPEIRPGLRRGR